ncbi:MAG: efflux RND transporter periplasmic adaptor subunit [Prevotellaceae bacterium]|jgi:RND family efflux transporter MFP subunit|nr:efflux RND transporter periplasmic adaptor subunit [Prevotellaceae bacterium]
MTLRSIIYPAIVFCLLSCASKKEQEEQSGEKTTTNVENKATEVKTKLLEYRDFSYELISNGTVAAINKAELRFQSQEIIRKIYVKNGDRVTKGQKLAELDKFKLEIAKSQAMEALERAKLDLLDALIGQGYSITDTAKISADVMKTIKIRSNYEQSHNNYVIAEYNLDAATLYAPFDGVVANLKVKEYNLPGSDAFCTIIDNRNPEVTFNVLESELPRIGLRYKVLVLPVSMSSYIVEGYISEINPIVDKNSMVNVKAIISNKDNKLYEGMNVKVRVQLLLGKQLVVPKSAVVLRNNKKVVFRLQNDRAAWVYVQTAQENSDSYVITEGLNEGDQIIYEGNFNLAHDAPIVVKN